MSQVLLRPLCVLVVEDDDDLRESLYLLVQLWGHACESAPSGSAAVQAAAAFFPDVVLMDICLPGMDGYKAAREIKQLPGQSDAAFVATTGCGRSVDMDRSYAEGFAAHLTKPFDLAELQDLLETIAAELAGLKPDSVC